MKAPLQREKKLSGDDGGMHEYKSTFVAEQL